MELLNNTEFVISTLLSLAGLFIGIYTFVKVGRVADVQEAERKITQELLRVDQLELDLRHVITKLNQTGDKESVSLATDLSIKLGAIQGVRRALDKRPLLNRAGFVRIEKGFFDNTFVAEQIGKAQTHIDIITGRTLLVAGFYVLDALRQACDRGVQVRLIGISDHAPDIILSDAAKTVSHPAPRDFNHYRQQIVQNKSDIMNAVNTWPQAVRDRFQYRVNDSVPRVSFLRSDEVVNLGFLQFYRDAQPAELKDREYLQIPANSGIGRVAMKHFDIAWEEGEQCLPPVETGGNGT